MTSDPYSSASQESAKNEPAIGAAIPIEGIHVDTATTNAALDMIAKTTRTTVKEPPMMVTGATRRVIPRALDAANVIARIPGVT